LSSVIDIIEQNHRSGKTLYFFLHRQIEERYNNSFLINMLLEVTIKFDRYTHGK